MSNLSTKNRRSQETEKISLVIWFVSIITADQITKLFFSARTFTTKYISLGLTKNFGYPLGVEVTTIRQYLILIGLGVLLVLIWKYANSLGQRRRIAAMLVAAGGASNLFDRIALGYVRDIINVEFWSVFNIADAAIFSGIIWLLVLILFKKGDRMEEEAHKLFEAIFRQFAQDSFDKEKTEQEVLSRILAEDQDDPER